MIIGDAIIESRRRLSDAGSVEAAVETEVLLRYALNTDASGLYMRQWDLLSDDQRHAFFDLLERRLTGEPTSYILGQREFYGLSFYVNSSVLIPRPETELLVEKGLELAATYKQLPVIADIGTGSGNIAITLAKYLPNAKIYATDISFVALATARSNARTHGVENRISFLQGNLLEPLPEPIDILLSNPPYVKSTEIPNTGEPGLALDGGSEGLDVVARLIIEVADRLNPPGSFLMEIGFGQSGTVCDMLRARLPEASVSIFNDLAGIPRVIQATLA